MRNPLNKRFPRELKSEFGKYLVLFVFITGMIGIISGFLVAGNSMTAAYSESFEKYNIENGNFELAVSADESLIRALEKEELSVYENFYVDAKTEGIDTTLRIFKNRMDINKVCLMEGALPENKGEIGIDRVYAQNNGIAVGDVIKAEGREFTVTAFVALPDYSTLYQNPSDMMFDSIKFGVGVVSENEWEYLEEGNVHYSYSWQYHSSPRDEEQERQMAEDVLEVLVAKGAVSNFVPRYANQAILFAGDDIGNDTMMMTVLLYILTTIIAFIFAITTSSTITKEATTIGTLRASGYTKAELIAHYLMLPMAVTFLSAIIGNILGYTWFKQFAVDLIYNSFSLTTYTTLWNADAFIKTTLIPMLIMFVINLSILAKKLRLSPLQFIRCELSVKRKKRAFRLNPRLSFMTRFRFRVLFQNIPNYITIIVGILLANIILLFGCGMNPLLDHYQQEITENMICDYQYILKAPVKTETETAEPYSACSLKTIEGETVSEEVTVYGIVPESGYISIQFEGEGVYLSSAYAEKHSISVGDTVVLRDEYYHKDYAFKVDGIYDYPSTLAVFMPQREYAKVFATDEAQFSGYFSDQEITDVDESFIAATITAEDMIKTSRQLKASMGGMAGMIQVFGIIVFMLIIYLLSKIIIEKNAHAISMTKILGYTNREINSLYIIPTSVVVIASLILTLPVVDQIVEYAMKIGFSGYPGYFSYYVPVDVYVKMVLLGIASYGVIAFFQTRKVKQISLDAALKEIT